MVPAFHRPHGERVLALVNRFNTNAVLDLENKRRFHRLQHTGRASLFTLLDAIDEVLVGHANVVDGASGTHAGWQVAMIDALIKYEHAARARSAKKLVRRDKNRIDARIFIAFGFRVHVNVDVRRTRREIETGDCVVLV